VLSVVRNAIGLPTVPPNQVVVGLALFLSLFTMAPTLSEINETALQPLLAGELEQGEAIGLAQQPIREFMFAQVGESELALFIDAARQPRPDGPQDVAFTSLVPAFILSELKAAFIIAFVVFIPFLIVDLLTSSTLMSMGMMMLPPVLVSLPFKLLLFVMVDGWTLVVRTLVESYAT
jgi:flagellar biosynthesis protein FliP